MDWRAPVFVGGEQVAVLGMGAPRTTRSKYTDADLDLLAELAGWVGLLLATNRQRLDAHERLIQALAALRPAARRPAETLARNLLEMSSPAAAV